MLRSCALDPNASLARAIESHWGHQSRCHLTGGWWGARHTTHQGLSPSMAQLGKLVSAKGSC